MPKIDAASYFPLFCRAAKTAHAVLPCFSCFQNRAVLPRGQIGPHTAGTDGHGGCIVQQSRCGRRQPACNTQDQKRAVESQNQPVILANAAQHPLGKQAQRRQLPQSEESSVISATSRARSEASFIATDTSAAANAGGVIDAIAHHNYFVSAGPVSLHQCGLICRQYLGPVFVNAQLPAYGSAATSWSL